MTTPDSSAMPEESADPPKRFRLVWIVLALVLIALAATVSWSLSSTTPEQADKASDVWVGNGWESTKIPTDDLHKVLSEIDRYRVRLDLDPEYQEADFYTDLFHANTLDQYRGVVDFYFDTSEDFYKWGEFIAGDADVYVQYCGSLDAYLHLKYVFGSDFAEHVDDVEAAELFQNVNGGRFWVDVTLQGIAVYGGEELQDVMDECGLNETQ